MTHAATSGSSDSHAVSANEDLFRLVVRKSKTIIQLNKPLDGGAPNLYCVHSVAGDVTDYRSFAKIVESHIAVCGVQVPLDRMRIDEIASIEKMAHEYSVLIQERQPFGPIMIGGFSAGAIIALEVAQQLILAGRDVPLLIAFDGAPSNTAAHLSRAHPIYLYRLFTNFVRCIRGGQIREWVQDGLVWRLALSFFLRPSGIEPLAPGSTLYQSAMRTVTQKCGWKADQVHFLRGMIDSLSFYRATGYPGRVLVFESRFQPLLHAPQIADVWRGLTKDFRIEGINASHSSLFRNEKAVVDMAFVLIDELSKTRPVGLPKWQIEERVPVAYC